MSNKINSLEDNVLEARFNSIELKDVELGVGIKAVPVVDFFAKRKRAKKGLDSTPSLVLDSLEKIGSGSEKIGSGSLADITSDLVKRNGRKNEFKARLKDGKTAKDYGLGRTEKTINYYIKARPDSLPEPGIVTVGTDKKGSPIYSLIYRLVRVAS